MLIAAFAVGSAAQGGPEAVIWSDPGQVENLDLSRGPGGDRKPQPPFTFVKEDLSGSSPKATVRDANGRVWRVKFGPEVNSDVFGARMAWACGYPSDVSYFLVFGHIEGVRNPQRIAAHLKDGHFLGARFALNEDGIHPVHSEPWTWQKNPFVGTPQLNGLKILMMLLSNWDNKDGRDLSRGSNTLVLERTGGGRRQWIYTMNDWGASMGKWGGVATREKWDCRLFEEQTPQFLRGVSPAGFVQWGFHGQHTASFAEDIRVEDVRWLMRYLGRISDAQIREALKASGAGPVELERFTAALRARIARLASL
jgi:hypothetical protein